MIDRRGAVSATGDALRRAYRSGAVAPVPADMTALLGRIDAAEAKRKGRQP